VQFTCNVFSSKISIISDLEHGSFYPLWFAEGSMCCVKHINAPVSWQEIAFYNTNK